MESLLIVVLLCSAIFSYILNKLLLRFSKTLGVHNQSDGTVIRWGSTSKPTLGGISFYITFILAALFLLLMGGPSETQVTPFIGMLVVVTLGFFIGLQDDAYNTKPMLKLAGQIACGVIMIAFGVYIKLTGIVWLDYPLTLFWVVGIMNSVNLLDNMDAVTGTVSLTIVATIIILMGLFEAKSFALADTINPFLFTLPAIGGALIGFLVLNWKPSELYMGDTGSQFLGALLAFVGVYFLWNIPTLREPGKIATSMQIITPVMTFLVPIMDTSFVTVARMMRGQSPFVGGKDHLTHHLTYIGVKEHMVPVLLALVSLLSGILAIFSVKYVIEWNHGYTAIFSGYIVISFIIFFLLYRRGERVRQIREKFAKRSKSDLSIAEKKRKEPEAQHN